MQTRISGWERASTDSVVARRFVRAVFEGHTGVVADLVAEDCVLHWAGHDDETVEGAAAIHSVVEMVASADLELEAVESTVSDGLVVTSVTACDVDGVEAVPVATETAGAPLTEGDHPAFASLRVEDDHVVELWLHVEEFETDSGRPLGGLVSRVSAWLHAD